MIEGDRKAEATLLHETLQMRRHIKNRIKHHEHRTGNAHELNIKKAFNLPTKGYFCVYRAIFLSLLLKINNKINIIKDAQVVDLKIINK